MFEAVLDEFPDGLAKVLAAENATVGWNVNCDTRVWIPIPIVTDDLFDHRLQRYRSEAIGIRVEELLTLFEAVTHLTQIVRDGLDVVGEFGSGRLVVSSWEVRLDEQQPLGELAEVVADQAVEHGELLALSGEFLRPDPLDVSYADEDVGEVTDRQQRPRLVEFELRPGEDDQR